ncbi:aminopeptidase P N-terminal domain-containing protein [Vulgatibacter sp.]|uniref:aminopeptidase P N-terminal domain-containing protein n=1 Tax=Vulgatibacter sp. TaxID=1971226 RepID=UPI0035624DC8
MDHRARRNALAARMEAGAVAIFPAAPERLRNNDAHHAYRQDSDFHWLTGFDEPQSLLLIKATKEGHESVLFVRRRDPAREIWDGRRAGVEGAVRDFGMDAAHVIDELDEVAPKLLESATSIVFRLGADEAWDRRVIGWLGKLWQRARLGVTPPLAVVDPRPLLHDLRLRKDPAEIEAMRTAARITGEAHAAAMREARDGTREYELQATIEGIFRGRGGSGPAYQTIVAAGENGTILHYRAGDEVLREGALCLIDAGAEYRSYAADVTRTFPVGGRFSAVQQECYELVLASQEAAIAAVRPGSTIEAVHDAAVRVLTEGMVRLGLLDGDVDALIESGAYKRFYMHRTSHWLGMDVHDVGLYHVGGTPRPLEPGMVLTVEPGLYVQADDEAAPERLRGIGIRIEDDVLVTEAGHEILSAGTPKTVEEIRQACGG